MTFNAACVRTLDVNTQGYSLSERQLNFLRQVDATLGRYMRTHENQWNANTGSDGCFVEFKLVDRNVW